MIIDCHAHVSKSDYGNADLLVSMLDEADVRGALVFPGGTMDVRKMTLYVTGELDAEQRIPNEAVWDALAAHPARFRGFVGVSPLDEDEAFAALEKAKGLPVVGVKLNPLAHKFSFSGDVMDAIAEHCAANALTIYSHSLFDPGASTKRYGAFARRHPNTKFILGHLGFGPADVHAMDLARDLPNLFLESSLANFLALSEAVRRAGAHKLIYGSEFPLSTPKIELLKIRELPAAFREAIVDGNARRAIPRLEGWS
ncbi:amidohydrolase [Sorangium cellulosum]|uniref:Amidohydrolase n=1 Tax=Sorangium cellulosum TaxID=56 RepID=A0A2L0F948_SORCE|nr:amidohydrolase family protein [Sorangium cellulosum]AUX48041.1 amidohydrolase [Sorangium cellulosum]